MKILVTNSQTAVDVDLLQTKRSLSNILEALEKEDREVSLVFVDDKGITEINRQYLGRNYPTNVIAFSMNEGEFGNINPSILGDIVISTETALRDARAGDLSPEDEFDYLMIHAILHLLGYDHELPTEAEEMEKKEKEVFFALKKYHLE
ncbi:MAG: rRNA maturation RNase YbeY [Syntrophales bacterium]|jgi:probable rRNA maturation factor|nr:rRNA maturation RNase YbeY [Syntrophales bacterium]